MIREVGFSWVVVGGKPRASGDDPRLSTVILARAT